LKNFAGDTPASTDLLSASSLALLWRRPFEQNFVAGIDDAGILGEHVFVKNLFEKKK
jgi:hypothetical protein